MDVPKSSWRSKIISEAVIVAEFLSFAVCSYVLFVSLFERPLLEPIPSANSTVAAEDENYGAATVTVLAILFAALALGRISEWATLPSLLGMLIAGIALRNIPLSLLNELTVPRQWSTVLRKAAFVVILLRGGLSLDAEALKKMKGAILRLSLLPCTAEATVIAGVSILIFGLSPLFGFLLGFLLAAASPAVVVPCMLQVAQEGYCNRGVTTIVIAACSLDDVYNITMFSLCLSILFASGSNPLFTILLAPVQIAGGCILGGIVGFALHYVRRCSRFPLLLCSSLAMYFGCVRLSIDAAGTLAALVATFVAAKYWRGDTGISSIENSLRPLWTLFFQPLLFGLIGFDLKLNLLTWKLVLLGLLVLAIGVAVRTVVAYFAVMGSDFSRRECAFIALSWLSKATVQAALASVAIDMTSRGDYGSDYEEASLIVFSLAVLSILATSPIGALIIKLTAPILMTKDTVREEITVVDKEDDRGVVNTAVELNEIDIRI